MEEKNEILNAVKEGFAKVEQRFDAVEQRFNAVEQRFDAVEQRFDAVDQRFDAVDQRFDAVDQRFEAVDQRFEAVDRRFDAVDRRSDAVEQRFNQEFASIRSQFAEQLDGVSDALHAETRALEQLIIKKANEARTAIEGVETRIGLLGENLGNVRTQLAQYHHRFEAPLEARVVKLEAQVWAREQEKKDGTAAESRRSS